MTSVTDRRYELIRQEDERYAELCSLVEGVPPERLLEAGVTEDWTGKDLLAHLACWMAEAANVLERIRLGTWERTRLDADAMNRRFYEACRDLSISDVRAELDSSRTRMFQEWGALPEITWEAEEWFAESGPLHIEEHLPQLRTFLEDGGS